MSLQCEASQPAFMTSEHSTLSLLNPSVEKNRKNSISSKREDAKGSLTVNGLQSSDLKMLFRHKPCAVVKHCHLDLSSQSSGASIDYINTK